MSVQIEEFMNITKKNMLYSGKAKSVYETNQKDLLIVEFRDDTTAFDGLKKEALAHKGLVNNQINAYLMSLLAKNGVPTHFEKLISDQESVVKRLKMIPLESVVRNIAAGSLCRRLGIAKDLVLNPPLHEWFLKNDALHDPMVNDQHAIVFGWATEQQLSIMKKLTLKINEVLKKTFADVGLTLVDSKYEFGIGSDGEIYLGDEISPDSCRIWDSKTHESLDKDRFRQDLGGVVSSYQQIASRLGIKFLHG